MLEELKLVTALLGKLAPFSQLKFESLTQQYSIEYTSIFSRIQKEMLNLISVFFNSDQLKLIKKEIELTQGLNPFNKETFAPNQHLNSTFLEIASNVCSFCLNHQIVFSPNIEASHLHPYSPNKMRLDSKRDLKLSLLLDFLLYSIENLEKSYELELDTLSKCDNVHDLSQLEKRQIFQGDFKTFEKMSENEKQFSLKQQINVNLKSTKQLTRNYISIIEKCLLILWRHIEFYLDGNNSNVENKMQSKEENAKFRQDLILSLNASLLKRFSIIDQKIQSCSKNGNFINALLKRIERIIHLNNSYNY
jgi:hypothetical protein